MVLEIKPGLYRKSEGEDKWMLAGGKARDLGGIRLVGSQLGPAICSRNDFIEMWQDSGNPAPDPGIESLNPVDEN